MGLFTKKKKTVTNSTSTATTTPVVPDWVANPLQQLSGKVSDTFSGFDPSKLVAGPTALQTTAATGAQNLGTPSAFKTASDILSGVAGAGPSKVGNVDIAGGINKFLNPYLKDVVDTSLADFDFGAGQARAGNKLALAGDTTFGGSGGAIQTALSDSKLSMDRGRLGADLRSGGYDRAAALAAQQAGLDNSANVANAGFADAALQRQLQAGSAIGNLGVAQGEGDRANLGLQYDIGEGLRGIQTAQNNAPLDLILKEIAARSGLDLGKLIGQTSTGTENGTSITKSSGMSLGDIAKIAQAAAMVAASDARLKQDIETLGYDDRGRRWVEYAYVWEPEKRVRGVIAQEVRETDPDAVIEGPSGLLFVDYSKLVDA